MRFWGSSAIVPLLVHEETTSIVRDMLAEDRDVVVWALTGVEVTSTLWRRSRSGELSATSLATALDSLVAMESVWNTVLDVAEVVARARRLLAAHPLRAADAVQLAAALVAGRERADAFSFVTLDDRLGDAARREGLRVLPAAA